MPARADKPDKNDEHLRIIPFSDVATHNKYDDAWLVVHQKVYDVTKWAVSHPGGNIILLGAGRDATILFESYHVAGVSASLLRKYCSGRCLDTKSYYDFSSEFYPTMKARVAAFFRDRKLSRRDAPSMMIKSLLIMLGWATSIYFMLVNGSWFAAALLGFFCAEIGVSVMHDGSHGAYSALPWLNSVAAMGMDLIGASTMAWEFQHVVGHHQYTNLVTPGADTPHLEKDPDVFSSYPFVRMHPESQPPKWFHRYQHIYAPVLFALFTMGKVFYSDYAVTIAQAVCHFPMTSRYSNWLFILRFIGMKAFTMLLMFAAPIYLHGWVHGLGLITLAHCVCGECLALMFIITHVTEGSSFPTAGAPMVDTARQRAACAAGSAVGRVTVKSNDWAAMQCRTSYNWALSSWMWSHLSGGLNHQVEHHLFPGICHVHYPSIQHIVRSLWAVDRHPKTENVETDNSVETTCRPVPDKNHRQN